MPEWFEKFIMKGNWFTHYNSLSTPFSTAVISLFFQYSCLQFIYRIGKVLVSRQFAASCIPLNSILPQVRKKQSSAKKYYCKIMIFIVDS